MTTFDTGKGTQVILSKTPLEITEVYWKNAGQNKYAIKIRVKLKGKGFRELYGDFRLFKPVDKVKFRY